MASMTRTIARAMYRADHPTSSAGRRAARQVGPTTEHEECDPLMVEQPRRDSNTFRAMFEWFRGQFRRRGGA